METLTPNGVPSLINCAKLVIEGPVEFPRQSLHPSRWPSRTLSSRRARIARKSDLMYAIVAVTEDWLSVAVVFTMKNAHLFMIIASFYKILGGWVVVFVELFMQCCVTFFVNEELLMQSCQCSVVWLSRDFVCWVGFFCCWVEACVKLRCSVFQRVDR